MGAYTKYCFLTERGTLDYFPRQRAAADYDKGSLKSSAPLPSRALTWMGHPTWGERVRM